MSLSLVPVNITDAKAFVAQVHRHHGPPVSGLFSVGACHGDEIVAVAIAGRPVARMLDDGWTVEVIRLAAKPGFRNACSMLYSAIWRAARALGYRRAVTYTLAEESGTSVRAAGWRCIGEAGGGSWNREGRPRVDKHPTQVKIRWETGDTTT